MKKLNRSVIKRFSSIVLISILLIACKNDTTEDKTSSTKEETVKINNIYWPLKAILPDGKMLAINAIDKEGNLFEVKAIQNSDQNSFLDIEAFVNDKRLPVKMILSDDRFAPVKAIDRGGVVYDIKAILENGEKLDVKGIKRFGNIISIKAIAKDDSFYGVKAISPTGKINDVKGIKINAKEKEMTLNGFNVYAHIKAIHKSDNDYDSKIIIEKQSKKVAKGKKKNKKSKKRDKKKDEFKIILWSIKVVDGKGKNIDVKAFDEKGNKFDVMAVQNSDQYSFMNIKAIVNGNELPIKVLVSEEEYSPVKAISRDGTVYDIKAIAEDGTLLDVKGVSRSGNIINLNAINKIGDFYAIIAVSPTGKVDNVKGIKIFDRATEQTLRGNKVYAHVKALTK